MSAVCQRFWRVDGRADTALGIGGQPSAYPSIPLSFPHSIHLSKLSIFALSNWVSLAKSREWGTEWKRRDGGVTGQFSNSVIHWTQHFHHNLWLLHVFPFFAPYIHFYSAKEGKRMHSGRICLEVLLFKWRCSYLRMVMSFYFGA